MQLASGGPAARDGRNAPNIGAVANGRIDRRAAPPPSGAADLQSATTTGAAAPSAPARRAATSNEVRFEAAKVAAEQRQMTSLSEMDDRARERSASERTVGSRRFALVNGVWTDAAYTTAMRTVTVKPFSAAYFALVQRFPELAEPFALSDRVVVAGKGVAIALAPAGAAAVESLDAAAIDAIARSW
jgi:hypothetical protein